MGIFADFNFDNSPSAVTALQSYTPGTGEVGGPWAEHTSYSTGDLRVTTTGRVYMHSVNSALFYADVAPPGMSYSVEGVISVRDEQPFRTGVAGRIVTSGDHMWLWEFYSDAGEWRLNKRQGGVNVQVGAWAETLATGDERTARLEMTGYNPATIKAFVNGVERISIADTGTNAMGFAGRAGMRYSKTGTVTTGTGAGPQFTSFRAYDVLPATFKPAWAAGATGIASTHA